VLRMMDGVEAPSTLFAVAAAGTVVGVRTGAASAGVENLPPMIPEDVDLK